MFVESPIIEVFLDRVIALTEQLVIGPGIDPASEVTLMIRPSERDKVAAQVQDAVSRGARIPSGGGIPHAPIPGYYYEPTILTGVTSEMPVMVEETFGPVIPIVPVPDFETALFEANQSVYGLGATLFTTDSRKVKRYIDVIEAGNVWINDPLIDNVAGPFGGMKRSGLGRELGLEGFEDFLETKHIHWEIDSGEKDWWFPWK